MHYPGDLDLDDPVNLPRSERPPDLPPPMAMLPSNRGMSNYHHDPRKLIGSFSVLLSREFSRLPQTESLLAGWFYWSGKTFVLPVILTRYVNKRPGKKIFAHYYVSREQATFFHFMSLLVRLHVQLHIVFVIFSVWFWPVRRAKNNLAGQRNRQQSQKYF